MYVFRSEVRKLKTIYKRRSDGEMIAEVRRVAKSLGHRPNTIEYKRLGKIPFRPIYNRFGSWSALLTKAFLKSQACLYLGACLAALSF
jgi:hypothetical protein